MTVTTASLGFPRIGNRRELKFALEKYWSGTLSEAELQQCARGLRASALCEQAEAGIDFIPSNDFSLYDHVLDMSVMLGAVPERYGWQGGQDAAVDLDTYFAMARGGRSESEIVGCAHQNDAIAMEMTKWFDTNYHFIVPELTPQTHLHRASTKVIDDYREAKAIGRDTRPILVGPVTWLMLAKGQGADPMDFLSPVIDLYADFLTELHAEGAKWVQLDEPALVLDLNPSQRNAFIQAYERLGQTGPNIMLTSYFGGLGDNLALATNLPVAGLHVDLVRAPEQLDAIVAAAEPDLLLSLGVIDGRNVWRADLSTIIAKVAPIAAQRDIVIAPSCSLLHVPMDLDSEPDLDPDLKPWLAFASQKLAELQTLKCYLNGDVSGTADDIADATKVFENRRLSARTTDANVARRVDTLDETSVARSPYEIRKPLQNQRLNLPPYPTTTIGSFPQTKAIRANRTAHNRGRLSNQEYGDFLRSETERAIRWQEEIDLDMLVHGEFERNDMVQYFGEKLSGFAFTQQGWVQSYGSRCVRPSILYGDVSRPEPMTVNWWHYAQSLTERPVKGMLTGPVTILNWSFVRDDQSRAETCRQIALAIRDEVEDLDTAGAKAIQIDEAALREGLPLRRAEWADYLDWAVECFRIAAAGAQDATQIHTHMCYSEFNDILPSIAAMDADVISIETSRSQMELLDAFADHGFPYAIGPGVYDIHAPRLPDKDEMTNLLRLATDRLTPEQIWVNPDCGLKTRRWEEVKPALQAMVAAAHTLRAKA